ncbi:MULTISPECIES: hypothetical protein [unclassified Paenibacillus]|uniref:hypothetical protein n=1 Tax=unclassified Paenibacillus TaxID=185978 RepID=UPI00277D6213|nr:MULTISPECIES: hypothetical protein [unclassified Paenibacillus]MDQ0899084.1 hypothetical protein [Paenibacillus sp. V4I7]MDQ0914933.1 hypothetical protein [Paenibacillus sp. V4I5]
MITVLTVIRKKPDITTEDFRHFMEVDCGQTYVGLPETREYIQYDEWDSYTSEKKCRHCINWQRMRNKALLPMIRGEKAQYHPFSFFN